MEKIFDRLQNEFILFLLAYKFGSVEENGETKIIATEEEIQNETKNILKNILKVGE